MVIVKQREDLKNLVVLMCFFSSAAYKTGIYYSRASGLIWL